MRTVDQFALELADLLKKHNMQLKARGGSYGSSSLVIIDKDNREEHDYYDIMTRGSELRGDL